MATNIPPHHLGEVINALIHLIDHPEATLTDILEIIPGPDFPTGGIINGTSGIREAYRTGRGKFTRVPALKLLTSAQTNKPLSSMSCLTS